VLIYLVNFILAVNLTYALIRMPRVLVAKCKSVCHAKVAEKTAIEVGEGTNRPLEKASERKLMTIPEESVIDSVED